MKLGVLISGRGSNLGAILTACQEGRLRSEVALVVSNVPGAPGLERARAVGVPTIELDHRAFPSRDAFDEALVRTLREHGVEWVVLAGFMRIITKRLLSAFPDRILNIHPSLLPSFPGLHAQRQAIEYGVKQTGCTVHLVDEGTDTGPILAQSSVSTDDADTEASLTQRLLEVEHALLVSTLRRIETTPFTVQITPSSRRRIVWGT